MNSDETSGRWYHGWNIVLASVVATMLVMGLPNFSFSLFLKDWVGEFHTRISFLQVGISIMGVMCALLAPIAGAMSDKYPARLVFGIGLGCAVLMCFAISFATAAWQIVAIYALLLPVATDFSSLIPANAIVSRWFVRRLGLAMGLTAFGVALAGIVVPPLVASHLPALGWRMVWRIGGVITALLLIPVVLTLRDRPTEKDGFAYRVSDGAASAEPHAETARRITWLDVFRRRNFWLLVISTLPMVGVYVGVMQNLAPILSAHGFGRQYAAILLACFSAAHLAANLLAGMLSDRLGNRLPLFGLAVLSAAGCLCVGFGTSLPVFLVGSMLVGLNGALWPLAGAATAVEFGSEGFGRAYGLLSLFLPLGVSVTFVIARLAELTGSYGPAFSAIAAVTLVCGAMALLMREGRLTGKSSIAVPQGGAVSPIP